MVRVYFKLRDGSKHPLDGLPGQDLMRLARDQGVAIEGACDGALACSTCHVVVDPDWVKMLPSKSVDESDLLSLAHGLTRTSRLACQIKLTDALDGLTVALP
jgi:2Fe-2S ferredoxin